MKNSASQIQIPQDVLSEFCRRNHIRKLAFFGSVLRDDFRSDSDLDVLVEFETRYVPGLIGLAGLENELGQLVGRKVDLNTYCVQRSSARLRFNMAKLEDRERLAHMLELSEKCNSEKVANRGLPCAIFC